MQNLLSKLRNKKSRDEEWKKSFLSLIPKQELYCDDIDPIFGPDNLPYVKLYLKPKQNVTTLNDVAKHCVEYGLGVILINDNQDDPEWVFSCGDMISLMNFGGILVGESVTGHEQYEVKQPETVQVGNPDETFLPSSIRAILKQDFKDNFKIQNPGVFLMHNPNMTPPHSMIFTISRDMIERTGHHYEDAMNRIAWHIPRHSPASSASGDDYEYYPL